MTEVTLDAKDIETLLFATGAIKAMESALKARKDDVQYLSAQPNLTAAHDRVAKAWREALRRERHPERFTPATDDEARALVAMWPQRTDEDWIRERFDPIMLSAGAASPHALQSADPAAVFHEEAARSRRDIRALMTRGLVEMGVRFSVMHWGSTGEARAQDSAEHWVRITRRGIEAVETYEEEQAKRTADGGEGTRSGDD